MKRSKERITVTFLLDSGSPRFELGSPGPEPGSLPS